MWRKEIHDGHNDIVRVMSDKLVILLDPQEMNQEHEKSVLNNRVREKQYAFDLVFHNKVDQASIAFLSQFYLTILCTERGV